MANSRRSSSSPPRRPQAENRDFVTGLLRRIALWSVSSTSTFAPKRSLQGLQTRSMTGVPRSSLGSRSLRQENASHTEFLSCPTQARPKADFLFALRDDPGCVVEDEERPLCCLDDTRECPSLIVSRRACIPTGGMYTCTPLKVGTGRPCTARNGTGLSVCLRPVHCPLNGETYGAEEHLRPTGLF